MITERLSSIDRCVQTGRNLIKAAIRRAMRDCPPLGNGLTENEEMKLRGVVSSTIGALQLIDKELCQIDLLHSISREETIVEEGDE